MADSVAAPGLRARSGEPAHGGDGPADSFDELRALLVGPEQRELLALQAHVLDPATQVRDVSRVLPDAIALRSSDPQLTRALYYTSRPGQIIREDLYMAVATILAFVFNLDQALALAGERGIPVRVIETREMERDAYVANGPDRCYHCKAELFGCLEALAETEGWSTIAYGAVTDDLGDVRPGMRAADRYQVRAPLLEAGLGKLEVRVLARGLGLPVWDKPQSACLASRIPHGSAVTREKLRQVERGEEWLRGTFGLRVVRLRHEGSRARIEVGLGEIARISTDAAISRIRQQLGALGFQDVWIDPAGYRRADPSPS